MSGGREQGPGKGIEAEKGVGADRGQKEKKRPLKHVGTERERKRTIEKREKERRGRRERLG